MLKYTYKKPLTVKLKQIKFKKKKKSWQDFLTVKDFKK